MTDVLGSGSVGQVLDRLFEEADRNDPVIFERIRSSGLDLEALPDDATRSQVLGEAYIPVSRDVGRLLYLMARVQRSRRIVEFAK